MGRRRRRSSCARRSEAGLDVLGLTDHDTAEAWERAVRTAEEVGITLVRGIEISTRHLGRGVHLLAYLPDPTYPPLVAHLRKILDGRSSRVPAILERLNGLGIDVDAADVRRAADGTAATGRPHVADALVTLGVVPDRSTAFRRLPQPRPARLREPVRRSAGRDDPGGRGGRWGQRARTPVGPARPRLAARRGHHRARRARPGRARGRPPGPPARGPAAAARDRASRCPWW